MELENSIEKHNDVVVRLAKHVITTVADGCNLVFSPTSINILLGIIAAGSNSETKEEILSFLNSPSTDHLNSLLSGMVSVALADGGETSDLRLSAANGVWIDKNIPLKFSFKELLENSYKATCTQLDFFYKPGEVIDGVNTWAEENTNGLIKQILSHNDHTEIIRNSLLILANAVYFKGVWNEKFEANLTKDEEFHLLDGTSVKVPFMTNHESQYLRYYEGFKVLRLPYVGDHQRQFSMYIYLPNDKNGLPTLLDKIASEPGFLDNHIPNHRISLDAFRIPKFKFLFDFKASDVLEEMGLTSPFSTLGGKLTEMVDSPSVGKTLYVSKILHKACIEVDEEGTEAAAVSVGIISLLCLMPKQRKPDFVADHSFLFTVREDNSGVILFMGQVLDPSKH